MVGRLDLLFPRSLVPGRPLRRVDGAAELRRRAGVCQRVCTGCVASADGSLTMIM
jgi:hypothetical protein